MTAALVPPPDTGGSTTAGTTTASGGETTSSSRARVSSGGSTSNNSNSSNVSFLESNSNHNNATNTMMDEESEVSFGSTTNVNDEISPLRVSSIKQNGSSADKDDFMTDSEHSQQQQPVMYQSSIRTVLSDEVSRDDKSFLGTFGNPVSAEDDESSSQVQIVSWTETLHTPSSLGAAFSPSSMVSSSNTDSSSNKTESSRRRHGMGLQLAVDRTRLVNKANRRCVALLMDVTAAYDVYASHLIKAGQMLQPAIHIIQNTRTRSTNAPPSVVSLQESMVSWSGEVSKLSAVLRTVIAQPLQTYFATQNETVTAVQNRYLQSRQQCVQLGQRTTSARKRYERLLRETEQIMADEQRGGGGGESTPAASGAAVTTANNKPPPSKKLAAKLKDIRRAEHKYKRLAQWENDCIKQCQRLEIMALETLQTMEEDRLFLFVLSLLKALAASKHALEKLVISIQENQPSPQDEQQQGLSENDAAGDPAVPGIPASSSHSVASFGAAAGSTPFDSTAASVAGGGAGDANRNRTMSFVKMLGNVGSSSFIDGPADDAAGCMDAETLGLPEEIGKLRDMTKTKLAARRERVQVAKVLALFLETVAKASAKVGKSLKHHHRKESNASINNNSIGSINNITHNAKNMEPLGDVMKSSEGERVARLWNGIMSFLETEADGNLSLAKSLHSLRSAKLEALVADEDKAVKSDMDSDDANWKQLCDAARTHSRAENRYRQSSAESAKARERMSSMDSEKNPQQPNLKVGKHMSKGLANMFSILPDGGEKAMKSFLPPGARASVAQLSLEEADQKEAKERLQYDETLDVKSLALKAYKSSAEALMAQCDEEAKSGWDHCRFVVESTIQSLQSLKAERLGSLASVKSTIGQASNKYYYTDINEWRTSAQQQLDTSRADIATNSNDSDPSSGFELPISLQRPSWLSAELAGSNAEEEEDLELSANEDDGDEDDLDVSIREDDELPATTEAPQTQDSFNESFDVQKLFSSFAQPNSPLAFRKMGMKKLLRRRNQGHSDPETAILLDYFWPDAHVIDVKNVTAVAGSFACSFRSASERYPIHYGRLYLSPTRIIFTSWTKKKLNFTWQEIVEVKESTGLSKRDEDTLMVTYQKRSKSNDSFMVLGGIRDRQAAFDLVGKLREEAKALAIESAASQASAVAGGLAPDGDAVPVPPDATLQKMQTCVSRHLRKISIQRFFEIVWSDKQKPLYEPWLAKASMDIQMEQWKEGNFVGPWDGERYEMERVVKFRIQRKTHLYIGPPIANVVQTHRCRVDGNDKCVLSMTVEFEGIPYADTFKVEIRWCAIREGANDIKIECGIFVDFQKKTFLKKQIQAGTIEEAQPAHESLFEAIQTACIAAGGEEAPAEEEEEIAAVVAQKEVTAGAIPFDIEGNSLYIAVFGGLMLLILLWRFLRSGGSAPTGMELELLNQRVAELEDKIDAMQDGLNEILALLKKQRA